MRVAEVIRAEGPLWVNAPPVEMRHEFAGQLSLGPRAMSESGQGVPEGEVDAFDKSSVDGARESERLEPSGQVIETAEAKATFDLSTGILAPSA
jgi:hypothetical protein